MTGSGDPPEGWAPLEPPPGAPPPLPPPGAPPSASGPYAPPPGYGPPPGAYPPPGSWPPQQMAKAGDARTGPLPLHPMTVGDILDGAFKLLKANAATIAVIVLVFLGPLQVISAIASSDLLGDTGLWEMMNDPTAAETALETQGDNGAAVASGVAALVNLLVLPFVAGAVSRVVAASYLGQQLSPGPALRATLRRSWALFAAWVLIHVLELVGFLFCILPGLLVMALSVAVAPAIVIEEIGPVKAIRRSWRLMRPRLWPTLGICLLVGLISNLLGQIIGFLPSFAGLFLGGTYGWLFFALGGILTSLVATPIVAITATLQYYDARIRHEGFDLELLAADVAGRVPAP